MNNHGTKLWNRFKGQQLTYLRLQTLLWDFFDISILTLYSANARQRLHMAKATTLGAITNRLASDPNPAIRMQTAFGNVLQRKTWAQLAKDPHTPTRQAVAANPNTPDDLVSMLASEPIAPNNSIYSLGVAHYAQYNLLATREGYKLRSRPPEPLQGGFQIG